MSFFRKFPVSKEGGCAFKFRTLGRQLGQSDVYDNSAVSLNRNRAPGSRARDKITLEKEKGQDGRAKWKLIGLEE